MEVEKRVKKLWSCPNCGRKFTRKHQAHSCRPFHLSKHFKGKQTGSLLFQRFKTAVKNKVGPFKIESLECCIHFVHDSIFAGVKVLKNKLQVDFLLTQKTKSKRFVRESQLSASRYVYFVDISGKEDIDEELMRWMQEAYDKASEKKPL